MIIPPLSGIPNQQDFFIYTACDTKYFDEFGETLINSVIQNSKHHLHIHLYNPTDEQIAYCNRFDTVTATYEYVPVSLFKIAANRWSKEPSCSVELSLYHRTITAMEKSKDSSMIERFQKTYFASARFFRLSQMLIPAQSVFAIDVDAIVRKEIPKLSLDKDFYIHHIQGKKARFLAGGLYINSTPAAHGFLKEYGNILKENIEYNTFQWGIDQDVLDHIVPKYNHGQLPFSYIDWEMLVDSIVWTAKGKRKEVPAFITEQKKYSV